jgi:hypothetical protein
MLRVFAMVANALLAGAILWNEAWSVAFGVPMVLYPLSAVAALGVNRRRPA